MNAASLKLLVTALIWGATFIAGRFLGPEIAPFPAAFLRFVAATIFLAAFFLASKEPLPRLDLPLFALICGLGLTGVFAYNALFFRGLQTVPAGRAAIIVAANPVFVALFSWMLFKDPLSWRRAAGIATSLLGACLVITHGNLTEILAGSVTRGDLFIAGAMLSWVAYSLLGKKTMGRLTPLAAVTLSCLAGMLFLLPPALMQGVGAQAAALSWRGWTAILFLGVFGTGLGFVWFYQGIRERGASRASVFINFVPVSAAALGALMLSEPVDASLAAGGVLVLCGVALTNSRVR